MVKFVEHDLGELTVAVPSDLKPVSPRGNFLRPKSRLKEPGILGVSVVVYHDLDDVGLEGIRSAILAPEQSDHPNMRNTPIRKGTCMYGSWQGIESLGSSLDLISGHVVNFYNASFMDHARTVLVLICGNCDPIEQFDLDVQQILGSMKLKS